jgi:uncharacterized protein (DUF1697 family)
MQTRINGILTLRTGRRTIDGILISENAAVDNRSELYTYSTVSEGIIAGNGTIWAHVSSKPIGGAISVLQTIIYYGDTIISRRYLQIMSGSCVITSPAGHGNIVS